VLRILGSPKKLCDQLTRRDMLWAGGLGIFGLGLGDLFRVQETWASTPARQTPRAYCQIILRGWAYPESQTTLGPGARMVEGATHVGRDR
jgi:hypothetical protein